MEREAATFLRIQTARDHAQPDNDHALLMVNNATAVAHGGQGIAPWTRVNDAEMHPPNTAYPRDDPPVWFARGAFDRAAKPIEYGTELFALP